MTDDRLRALERTWKETGTVEAEAEFLRERLRAGKVSDDGVRLAAFLGSKAARQALGLPAYVAPNELDARELSTYGREAVSRVCIAASWAVLPYWETVVPENSTPRRAIEEAERFVLAPGDPDEFHVDGTGRAEHFAASDRGLGYESAPALAAVAIDYTHAGVLHGNMGTEVVTGHSIKATRAGGSSEPSRVIGQAIRADVVPWALGLRDPVAERVAARGGGA